MSSAQSELVPISAETRSLLNGPAAGLYIDGRWEPAESGGTFEVIDPADESKLRDVSAGAAADVDRAVKAARVAFDRGSWRGMSAHERSKLLFSVAEMVERHRTELAEVQTLEVGLPLAQSYSIVDAAATTFRYYAGWPTKAGGSTGAPDTDMFRYTVREPVGVCGLIVGWNGPMGSMSKKLGPALAMGNTVVFKPAEQAPLTIIRFFELLAELDLPPGVVNLVTGMGESAGAALAGHPGVDKISFTGSVDVGRSITHASADRFRRLTLELGGKSPNIVFADSDLAQAAATSVTAFTLTAGQVCVAGSRLFVQRSIVDDFRAALLEAAQRVRVGHPLDPATEMGPLISQTQLDRVLGYVASGREQGAALLTGGRRLDRRGYFLEPTVFGDVDPSMRIVQEEIFGPVVAMSTFEDEQEAIALANDTDYGLAATVWTENASRAQRVAQQVRAGTVWINTFGAMDISQPFGGFKLSGVGREQGKESIDAFSEVKSVFLRL